RGWFPGRTLGPGPCAAGEEGFSSAGGWPSTTPPSAAPGEGRSLHPTMDYRCEATTVEGFVQQLACCYLPHGYWFYVSGWVPGGRDPRPGDRKLLDKYVIAASRQARARRKLAGLANLHYLRHGRLFVLLATHGKHRFFAEEGARVRDIRRLP